MKLKSLLSSLIVCGLASVSYSLAQADTSKVYRVANVESQGALHLRTRPTAQSDAILELPYDARWIVMRNNKASEWQKINWNDQEGWVNTNYLSYDSEASSIVEERRQCLLAKRINPVCCGYPKQAMKPGKLYPIEVFDVVRVEQGQSLNMRLGPGIQNKIVATLPHNAKGIVKLPKSMVDIQNQRWEKIRWNGRNGWVNSAYLAYNPALSKEKTNIRAMCSQ